jgi:16S rRNA (cytosine967-C5)-methyltransferase
LVKQARVGSAAGLVNAVLRRAINHLDEPPGERITDPEERASIELSHPRWLLERWQSWLGPGELRALALANNSIPRTCFRVNTLRSTLKGVLASLEDQSVAVRESEIAPKAFVVESGPARAINEAARQGLIYIQDEASQLVSHLLEARPGDRVLDLCAAPGSKSSHIAGLTADDAWIVACDLYTHRLKTLLDNCRRLEVSSVNAVALDATRALPFDRACSFDRVLVDAPCSGTGTLRANPEIKWRLKDEDIARLAKLQLALLTRAASSVAGGGGLVYSTCSLEREENEDIVRAFLENNSEFRVTKPNAPESLTTPDGFVRTYPHRDGCDGFFAAVLEKEE